MNRELLNEVVVLWFLNWSLFDDVILVWRGSGIENSSRSCV